jgi:hypothetical protein
MLPAPATIAAAPTASSRPSWNPAVLPPPVTGAPLGIVVDWVGVGVTVWVTVTVGVGLLVAGVLALEVLVLLVMPGVVTWAVLLGVEVLPAVPVPVEALVDVPAMVKEDTDGDGDPDPEHAERVAMPSMVRTPQPAAVSLALSAVLPIAVRAFIGPPHAPFPRPRHRKPPQERNHAADPAVCPHQPKAAAGDHNAMAHGRDKPAMARPPLQY